MAEQVEDFDFGPNRVGRPSKYPWAQWLNLQTWELTQGVDFHITRDMMVRSFHSAAGRKGLKALTRMVGDNKLIVKAYIPQTNDPRSS